MSTLASKLGSNFEVQLGKVFSASVGAYNHDTAISDLANALGMESEPATEAAQEAIDGLIEQTLTNIGMEYSEGLEAKWWTIPAPERASIAHRLLNRDKSVLRELRKKLK